jgi:hypothetical protein
MSHALRSAIVVLWAGWICYTCVKRAIKPPPDNSSWWYTESYSVNKNPLVRALNVLAGILVLAIGVSVAFGQVRIQLDSISSPALTLRKRGHYTLSRLSALETECPFLQ